MADACEESWKPLEAKPTEDAFCIHISPALPGIAQLEGWDRSFLTFDWDRQGAGPLPRDVGGVSFPLRPVESSQFGFECE